MLQVSYLELCDSDDLGEQLIMDAVEYGVISPLSGVAYSEWTFCPADVVWLRRAIRLREDLELDWVSVALVVELLQKNESLEQENERLRQRLDRFLSEE